MIEKTAVQQLKELIKRGNQIAKSSLLRELYRLVPAIETELLEAVERAGDEAQRYIDDLDDGQRLDSEKLRDSVIAVGIRGGSVRTPAG